MGVHVGVHVLLCCCVMQGSHSGPASCCSCFTGAMGCALRLCAGRLEVEESLLPRNPWAMVGSPLPPFQWGSAAGCCTASVTAAPSPLLPLLSLLLFSGPPIPHGQNCTPPKNNTLGTLFCHHQLGTGPCREAETGTMAMENAALQSSLIHMWVAAGQERATRPCATADGLTLSRHRGFLITGGQ